MTLKSLFPVLCAASFPALLGGCGSTVVTPDLPGTDASMPSDVAPMADGSAVGDHAMPPPSPLDVPTVDAASPQTLAAVCQTFCQRGNAVCRASVDCTAFCREGLARPEVNRCAAQVIALFTCSIDRNTFICRPGSNTFEPAMGTCARESEAFQRCVHGISPPPPVDAGSDAGTNALRDVCAQVCDRMARDCGMAPRACVDQCATVSTHPNYGACSAQVLVGYECVVRNGVTCGPMGMNQPSRECAPVLSAAARCLGGGTEPPPPPPPPPVDGGIGPAHPGCVETCALADRACGRPDPGCPEECSKTASQLDGRCRELFEEMLQCVRRNGFVCRAGLPLPASACDPVIARLQMCFD